MMMQLTSDSGTTPQSQRPFALVTGASSGIGNAFATLLAKDGYNLVLTSRNETRLQEVKSELEDRYSIDAKVIPRDLSDPKAPPEIFEILRQEGIVVGVLINNAGYNVYGRFEETDLEEELKMIRLHIGAITHLTKLFLRQRPPDEKSMILNVSSVAALVPGPLVSVHFATRAHTLSFSQALAYEFRGTNVNVTCLCPGPTRSEFFNRASMNDVRLASGAPIRLMDAGAVAAVGYAALKKGKVIAIPGLGNRIWALMASIAPRPMATKFTNWLMQRR
jgi:short-subunit dehydrogenase